MRYCPVARRQKRLEGSSNRKLWKNTLCRYEFCDSPSTHLIEACYCLHWICENPSCGIRGHKAAICHKYSVGTKIEEFMKNREAGVLTRQYRQDPRWGMLGGKGTYFSISETRKRPRGDFKLPPPHPLPCKFRKKF